MVDANGPLAGVKVLDLGRVLAAPWSAQLLADMGADVIKVERPGNGDDARQYGPETIVDAEGRRTLNAAMFLCANRNKRSVTIDFAVEEGRDLLLKLAAAADVVVENFLPGTLDRYGLGYEALRAVNPGLIVCSLTGYGQTGPYRNRPGYDAVFQAESGMMAVTGMPDGQPGGGPMKTGPSLIDVTTGVYAASAILAALLHRERTGEGQAIDVNLLETALAMQTSHIQNFLLSGVQPQRLGNEGNGGHPARTFACANGLIYISAGNTEQYRALCEAIGRPDLGSDERFHGPADRLANRRAFNGLFEPIVATRDARELSAALTAARVPNALVKEYEEVLGDPQVVAREMIRHLPHAQAASGKVSVVGSPIRFSKTPVSYHSAPPLIGEHNRQILGDELGIDDGRLEELRARGVI